MTAVEVHTPEYIKVHLIQSNHCRAIYLRKLSSKTADSSSLSDVPTGCTPDVEQPVPRLNIAKGRPDVPSLLADIASSGARHREIGVIAAGVQQLSPGHRVV